MKNVYTYSDVKRGELTGFFGFAAAIRFALLVTWVAGCGSEYPSPEPGDVPVVEISCDRPVDVPRCFVLVWNADSVEAFYGGELAWWDYDISDEGRVTYTDAPGEVFLAVEACNDNGCVVEWADLRWALALNDDPIGCDPDLPCPEVLA